MESDGVKRIHVQPRRELKRTSSRLGSGGNSSFSVEIASPPTERAFLRPYEITNLANIDVPPLVSEDVQKTMSRRQDDRPSLGKPRTTKTEVQRVQMTDLIGDEEDAGRRPAVSSDAVPEGGTQMARFVSSTNPLHSKTYQELLSKMPPRSSTNKSSRQTVQLDSTSSDKTMDYAVRFVVAYWSQMTRDGERNLHVNQPSKEQISQQVQQILSVCYFLSYSRMFLFIRVEFGDSSRNQPSRTQN